MHPHVALISRVVVTLTVALLCAATSAVRAQDRPPTTAGAPPVPETATEPQGLIAEPKFIRQAHLFADRHMSSGDKTNGFYVDSGSMIPGSGWIAVGPGYRRWFSNDVGFVDASSAISWRSYKHAQVRVEMPKLAHSRLTIGSQLRWQDAPQINFYGEGTDTLVANASQYRLRSTNLVGYATVRPAEWLGINAKLGWIDPSISAPAGTFRRDRPDARDVFRRDIVYALPDQPAFVQTEVSVTADTRDFPEHPLRGGLVRAVAARYSDRDTGLFTFRRYEGEAAGFVPVADGRLVFALHGWLVNSHADEGRFVPFYLQPSLGGSNSLRSFADYRFHDRNMLLISAEARIALMTHVQTALFMDAGNVAAHLRDVNLARRSYGVGLRFHSRRQTFARLDLARGSEGWRMLFRMNDPLNLSRLSRRTAPMPFVP